ncbi:sigma-70 family RNA polymerase sigma factor [Cytobacillus oceanisediminis]|uniref:sigma-70 family RNA polymerase sigma factor n=1 Tax=Cytobacillus oceanisediminis TaxID=665099 RepID=UPI0020B1C153|nr:sigma-70 family RNA polymerase sigma factor [Cytobacillus oceanisediminis]
MYLHFEEKSSVDAFLVEEDIHVIVEDLMIEYGSELTSLAFSYVKDTAQAKDIVQNVFISCYQHLHQFKGNSSIKTWLYRITINQCKDYLKSSYIKRIFFLQKMDNEMRSERDPEIELLSKDRKSQVEKMVLSLAPKYKEVIFLFYYKDFSIKEISSILKISANTVKTRLKRGRELLKRLMEERGFEWENF